jgi:hypothetical protein
VEPAAGWDGGVVGSGEELGLADACGDFEADVPASCRDRCREAIDGVERVREKEPVVGVPRIEDSFTACLASQLTRQLRRFVGGGGAWWCGASPDSM